MIKYSIMDQNSKIVISSFGEEDKEYLLVTSKLFINEIKSNFKNKNTKYSFLNSSNFNRTNISYNSIVYIDYFAPWKYYIVLFYDRDAKEKNMNDDFQ